MKATTRIVTALLSVGLGFVMTGSTVNAATTISKRYEGLWLSKPTYTYQMKHIKKNMAIPALKLAVHSHFVKWQFVGTLPTQPGSHYDRKVHKLYPEKADKQMVTLKGKGPFGTVNLLVRIGSKLQLGYQNGGEFNLHRISNR